MVRGGLHERGTKRWRSPNGASELSLLEYAGTGVDPESFVAFARLIRPPLIARDGVDFLAAHCDEYFQPQWAQRLDEPAEVQRVINRVHVSTLFERGAIERAEALRIAELLADMWTAVFAELGLRGEVCGEGGDDIGVTLVATSAAESAAALARVRASTSMEGDLLGLHEPAA